MTELLLWNLCAVLIPTALAGILHIVAVRYRMLEGLAVPLWTAGFGRNKTWRGVVLMLGLTALTSNLSAAWFATELPVSATLWGCGLGLAYVVAELPNSWVKRRMGIPAGGQSSRVPWLSALADKLDSALLGSLILAFWIPENPNAFGLAPGFGFFDVFAGSLAVNSGVHAFLSAVLVVLGIKSRF